MLLFCIEVWRASAVAFPPETCLGAAFETDATSGTTSFGLSSVAMPPFEVSSLVMSSI